jgi:DNA replication protein DnaC
LVLDELGCLHISQADAAFFHFISKLSERTRMVILTTEDRAAQRKKPKSTP